MRPNTRLVIIETPSNPLMKITDLAAVAQVAHRSTPLAFAMALSQLWFFSGRSIGA